MIKKQHYAIKFTLTFIFTVVTNLDYFKNRYFCSLIHYII